MNLGWVHCAAQQSCSIFIHSSTLLDTIPSLSCPQTTTSSQNLILSCWLCFPLLWEHGSRQKNLHRLSTHLPTFSVWTFWQSPPDTGWTPLLPSEASPFHSLILFPSHPLRVILPSLSRPFSSPMNHSYQYSNCSYSSHFKTFSWPTFLINCCHIVLWSHSQQTSEELTILTNSSPPSLFL